jgi:RNA polymerase sigma-70 factor (ECF subfamily)
MDADAELLLRVAGGDTGAFKTLVERNEKAAYNFFLRLTGISEDAEDLTQELFVALFRAAGRYRSQAPFRAYLYRIATNLAMSHLRKRKLRIGPSMDAMIESGFDLSSNRREDDPSALVESREMLLIYEAALARLPHEWRLALELRIGSELSYEEIAEAMGKSISAVESTLFRARERIAEEMEKRERDGNKS